MSLRQSRATATVKSRIADGCTEQVMSSRFQGPDTGLP